MKNTVYYLLISIALATIYGCNVADKDPPPPAPYPYSLTLINNTSDDVVLEFQSCKLSSGELITFFVDGDCVTGVSPRIFEADIKYGGFGFSEFNIYPDKREIETLRVDVNFSGENKYVIAGWSEDDYFLPDAQLYGVAYFKTFDEGIITGLDPGNTYTQLDLIITVNSTDEIAVTIDESSITKEEEAESSL